MKQSTSHNFTIHIMIADDQPLFREGIKRYIHTESDMEVVGECKDGSQIIEVCEQCSPDILLMDIRITFEQGTVSTEKIKLIFPKVKIIIFSVFDHFEYVIHALGHGADGFLLKDIEAHVLLNAIRCVAQGEAYIHPRMIVHFIQYFRLLYQEYHSIIHSVRETTSIISSSKEQKRNNHFDLLTKREMEVLHLMVKGQSNKLIAAHLFISEKTVKNHVSSILRKIDVDDRTQAVIAAIRRGWIMI
jgi:two-component system response regulator DegU